MHYTYKVWVADGNEHFEYGNEQTTKRDFPFAESLMDLLYFDIRSLDELFDDMEKALMQLHETKAQRYADRLWSGLDTVAKQHIYFELLRLDWQERLTKAQAQNYRDIVKLLPSKKLAQLPSTLSTMQKQMKALFSKVLDLDASGKGAIQEKMAAYSNAQAEDGLRTFPFQPQSLHFERIDKKTFTEVLYPKDVYDLIDYFLRTCIKREQPVRICKSCGRYFAISGRISAEYCDRPTDGKGRTCKSTGSIKQWNEKRKNDQVFQIYRRAYKKRFGWIKAGKIEQSAFYAWSEAARKQKASCDNGELSLQEFAHWLEGS